MNSPHRPNDTHCLHAEDDTLGTSTLLATTWEGEGGPGGGGGGHHCPKKVF